MYLTKYFIKLINRCVVLPKGTRTWIRITKENLYRIKILRVLQYTI